MAKKEEPKLGPPEPEAVEEEIEEEAQEEVRNLPEPGQVTS